MRSLELSGRLVGLLARSVSSWADAGKLDDVDLDRRLSSTARALVDSPDTSIDWVPVEEAECLVQIVSDQVGGSPGLVEWIETVLDDWSSDPRPAEILAAGRVLVDGAGFVVAQASDCLLRGAQWRFDGGRERFSVRVRGLESMSPESKTLLGALLTRFAEGLADGFEDLRFEGVDDGELCIFGERAMSDTVDGSSESRLHRAALVA
jgi:hypothetical protein